jgi:hypothetical protein
LKPLTVKLLRCTGLRGVARAAAAAVEGLPSSAGYPEAAPQPRNDATGPPVTPAPQMPPKAGRHPN